MQWLIDGYNVMHAAGAIESRTGRERFRQARKRFLNRMAAALGPLVHDTTVVFDASKPPGDFPIESVYKGITVVFALSDEDADARIEGMIAHHSNPKALTVVSTDRRVRQAATRRKAKAMRADDYLDRMKTLAHERPNRTADRPDKKPPAALMDDAEKAYWEEVFGSIDDDLPSDEFVPQTTKPADPDSRPTPKPAARPKSQAVDRTAARHSKPPRKADENAHWQKVFGSIDDDPELREALHDKRTLLTDAEIAEIQREVDRES